MGVVEAVNGNIKVAVSTRTWLPGSALPASEGAAHGRHQDRIHRFPESRVECVLLQILAQSQLSSVIMTGVESRYFLQTTGIPTFQFSGPQQAATLDLQGAGH